MSSPREKQASTITSSSRSTPKPSKPKSRRCSLAPAQLRPARQANPELPPKPAHYRLRRRAGGAEHVRQAGKFSRSLPADIGGVNTGNDKQAINSEPDRPGEIGSDRIANREYAIERRRPAATNARRLTDRCFINRRVRLAAIEHLAANFGIGVRECACAINQGFATLDHDVGICAQHE